MRTLVSVLSGVCCVLTLDFALAQEAAPLTQFNPAPAGDWSFGVEAADIRGMEPLRANLVLDYAHDSLVLRADGERIDAVISHQLLAHPGVSYALFERLLLSLSMPIPLGLSGESPRDEATGWSISSPEGAEFGDLRLGARVRVLELSPEEPNVSFSTQVWLPTGTRDSYVNDESARANLSAIGGARNARFAWSVQPGVTLRRQRSLLERGVPQVGTALTFGAAFAYFVAPEHGLALGAELHAQNVVVGEASLFDDLGAELLAEVKVRPARGALELGVAAGPGLTTAPGVPELRVLGSVAYAPNAN